MILLFVVTALSLLCAASVRAAGGVLLVRHLKGQSMDAGKAVLLTDLVIEDLRSTGQFTNIYSMSDLEAMLTQLGDQQKVDMNCDTTKCMLEYGNALGAERVLSGNVGKLGSLAVTSLTVFNTRTGSTEVSRTWKCDCSEEVLAERIAGYAREIFGLETPAQREARLEAERRGREEADRREREARAVTEARLKTEQEVAARAAAQREQEAAAQRKADEEAAVQTRAAAEQARRAEEARTRLGPTLGFEWVSIPGGEFQMGSSSGLFSSEGNADERPKHPVRISDYRLAKTELTQAQWVAVMGNNPSNFQGCEDCPVERVSWNDVQEFIRKASAQTGLSLRLPTEAEWEYAAGGGVQHQKWAGTNNENELGNFAWYDANSGNKTHPVCQKRPNQFGLCDMSGNVWEWCSDWYDGSYYAQSSGDNPTGPSSGALRVIRGGGWGFDPWSTRVASRYRFEPGFRNFDLGFRLAASPGQR